MKVNKIDTFQCFKLTRISKQKQNNHYNTIKTHCAEASLHTYDKGEPGVSVMRNPVTGRNAGPGPKTGSRSLSGVTLERSRISTTPGGRRQHPVRRVVRLPLHHTSYNFLSNNTTPSSIALIICELPVNKISNKRPPYDKEE